MSEKATVNNKSVGHSKLRLIVRSSLVLGMLAILIVVAFAYGITNAWFSSNVGEVKAFNADADTVITETFNLEVINLNVTHNESWGPGGCLENQYLVANNGTVEMYVRGSFEGFWKRVLHRNTAKVTAIYDGQTLSNSDQAHLSFGKFSPPYISYFTPEATKGLFDESIPKPSKFPIVRSSSNTAESTGNILIKTNNSPSIKIVKQVSIDYGTNWIDADEAPGPELMVSTPKFRFLVTNTGNVLLEKIVVEDDVFGLIGTKDYLEVGESVDFIKDKYSHSEVYLETDNVTIELCNDTHGSYTESDWKKIGKYFYYLHKIDSGQSVTLCVKVCLTETTGIRYEGAEFYLNSYFEAAQSENGIVHSNWFDNPYQ